MTARVQQLTSGEINTWIIGGDDEAIVIDPGHDPALVLDEVTERDEAPVALHPRDRTVWAADPPEIEMADGGSFEVADVRDFAGWVEAGP